MRTKLFLSFGLLAVCVLFIRFLLSVIVTKWHKQMKFLRKKRQHQFWPSQKPTTAEKREVTDTINISENRWDRFLYTAVAHFTLVCVLAPFRFQCDRNAKQLYKAYDFDGNVIISDFLNFDTTCSAGFFLSFFSNEPDNKKREKFFISPNKW